ncbi:uncharacterized protein DMAD_01899 [Drosophila madeirensis]|uniref:Secreted protein n=1 Tax=Drosophila madeirensis TaxID=30013 RepID=A0AAU9G3E5_DROMD
MPGTATSSLLSGTATSLDEPMLDESSLLLIKMMSGTATSSLLSGTATSLVEPSLDEPMLDETSRGVANSIGAVLPLPRLATRAPSDSGSLE